MARAVFFLGQKITLGQRWLKRFWMVFLFWTCVTISGTAQGGQPIVEDISRKVLDLIKVNLDKMTHTPAAKNLGQANELFNIKEPYLDLTGDEKIYEYKIKKDIGLHLKAQYYLNDDASFDAEDVAASELLAKSVRDRRCCLKSV